jgi:hypothetical protein
MERYTKKDMKEIKEKFKKKKRKKELKGKRKKERENERKKRTDQLWEYHHPLETNPTFYTTTHPNCFLFDLY